MRGEDGIEGVSSPGIRAEHNAPALTARTGGACVIGHRMDGCKPAMHICPSGVPSIPPDRPSSHPSSHPSRSNQAHRRHFLIRLDNWIPPPSSHPSTPRCILLCIHPRMPCRRARSVDVLWCSTTDRTMRGGGKHTRACACVNGWMGCKPTIGSSTEYGLQSLQARLRNRRDARKHNCGCGGRIRFLRATELPPTLTHSSPSTGYLCARLLMSLAVGVRCSSTAGWAESIRVSVRVHCT